MHTGLKVLIGLAAAGGSAGLGIGGHYLFKSPKPTTLKEKLNRENLQILDYWTQNISSTNKAEIHTQWVDRANKYKDATDQNKKFKELTITNASSDFESLRIKCKNVLEKPIAETKDLEAKAKQWCTVTPPNQ